MAQSLDHAVVGELKSAIVRHVQDSHPRSLALRALGDLVHEASEAAAVHILAGDSIDEMRRPYMSVHDAYEVYELVERAICGPPPRLHCLINRHHGRGLTVGRLRSVRVTEDGDVEEGE
jgi:hypothetical protein